MSRKRIYLTLFLLLAIVFAVRSEELFTYEMVERGTAGGEFSSGWPSLISREINKKKVKLYVDGREVDTGKEQVVMSEDGDFLIPVSALTDAFSCAVHYYNDMELIIQKNKTKAQLYMGQKAVVVNGESYPQESGLSVAEDVLYVPAKVMETAFSYELEWKAEEHRLFMTSAEGELTILPEYYDYRETGRAPKVKNQGSLGTCWAFASLMALESRLLPGELFDFSEDHMSRKNSFQMDQNDGGEYTMSMAYLLAWQGPVLESEDVYGDSVSPEGLKPAKHVQSIQVLPSKDYEAIKEAVFFYGGVQSSLYTSMITGKKESGYYNKEKGAYCYMGAVKPNHPTR